MKDPVIGKYGGRPIILFPPGWQHGWLDANKPDPNAALSRKWSLQDWKAYRTDYYLGIMPCPFGYDTSDPDVQWPGRPYAPWGISKQHDEPRLHPSDI